MYQIQQTEIFGKWLSGLRDARAKARIIGGGVREMRMDVGAGYRLYFIQRGTAVVVLLCGGDKSSQSRDVGRAKAMARKLDEE